MSFADWAASLPCAPQAAYRHGLLQGYRTLWMRIAALDSGVSVRQVGQSISGQPIWCVVAGKGAASRVSVLVVAGLHAMEHLGPAIAVTLMERAVDNRCEWPNGLAIVPLVNPDGFLHVERRLAEGYRGFSRLNRRGVDLNRNFAVGASRGRVARLWDRAGVAPLSEPETQCVNRALEEFLPSAFVSLHSFGNILYLPHAHTRQRPENYAQHVQWAERMTAAQDEPFRVRQLGRHIPLFRARGTELDHAQGRGALSFLMEIGAGPRVSRPGSMLRIYQWYTPPGDLAQRDIDNTLRAVEVLSTLG